MERATAQNDTLQFTARQFVPHDVWNHQKVMQSRRNHRNGRTRIVKVTP